MTLFVVRFTDKPGTLPIRERHLAAHLQWLDLHKDSVRAAGPLREEPDGAPVGAIWIVEADSRAAVEAMMQSDPFWIHGVRQDTEVLHWHKAFPAGSIVID